MSPSSAWRARRAQLAAADPVSRLIIVSVVAGLLAAVVLLPVIGAFAFAAGQATSSLGPASVQMPPAPQRSRVLAADGTTIAEFFSQDRVDLPLDRISPWMQKAIVAIEDARFFHHGAVDIQGTLRAALADLGSGATVQGGSTLTQQYVKNVFVADGQKQAAKDTLGRKVREARIAMQVEKKLTKQQILDRYLNIVYFGEGAYGVEAAARRYFGIHASDLNAAQSALLAGLVQSPTAYDPITNPRDARARRDTVLARMAQVHDLTPAQLAQSRAQPLRLHPTEATFGCHSTDSPFFCAWVQDQLLADPRLGRDVQSREHLLMTGGLTVRTTLSPHAQAAAQHAVDTVVPASSRVATAVDVVQPGTGAVLAMAVDRPYGSSARRHETRVNLAVGGQSGFQAGSTFKLFTLAAAIQHHVPLSRTFYSPPQVHLSGFRDCGGAGLGSWAPKNAEDGEGGTFGLVRATWESVNTYFAQLEREVGVCSPWRLARAMGITEISTGRAPAQFPAFTLGIDDTSPLQVAAAYATFAARGVYCSPLAIHSVTAVDGRVLERNRPRCHRVVDTHTADTVTSVLRGVIDGPDPKRTGASASIGRPAAGKTGTTDAFSAAWFSGYTPQLAASVWVGDPRGGVSHPLRDVQVGSRFYSHVYGADLPTDVWRETMQGALAGMPLENFAGAGAQIAADQMVGPPPKPARHRHAAPKRTPTTPATAPRKKHGHH